MKVAFINQPWNTVVPPVSSGSIPIWTYETAKRLIQRSAPDKSEGTQPPCEVIIYSRNNGQQTPVEIHDGIEYRRISAAGTKLYEKAAKIGTKWFSSFCYINSLLYSLPYALRIALDLRQRQCDIAHIHNFSSFIPIIKAFNPRIKLVLHMHCEWLNQFDRAIMAKRLAQTDLIVGCSDYITNKIKAQFPEFADRCQRVFNGVDTEQFSAETSSASILANDPNNAGPNVLFVGRISPEKGLHTLLEAFTKLTEQFPTARLHIVGPHQPTSAKFIAELSDDPLVRDLIAFDSINYLDYLKAKLPPALKDRVFFPGAISHQTLHHYFQTADILVNPSVSESFGMSLAEAMAVGIPTVATRVGGMADVVLADETGLLVPPEQPSELAEAMGRLLSDRALRTQLGKAGRARAVELFSWKTIASDLGQYYAQLLIPEAAPTDKNYRNLRPRPPIMRQPRLRGSRL